jgi:hypothetical protein
VHWTVEKVNGRRVVKVRLRSDRPWPEPVLEEAGMAGRSDNHR